MIKKLNLLIVTFFGIGYIKVAPGTFASMFTCIILYFSLHQINFFLVPYILLTLIILFFYSLFAIKTSVTFFNKSDPKEIVIDEVIGQSLPILFFEYVLFILPDSHISSASVVYHPLGLGWETYLSLFLIFRFFDIFKPFPINWFDKKIKNSFGVLFDDIFAAIYTILTFYIILSIIPFVILWLS